MQSVNKPIPLFRSKYETFQNCNRQRFLAYELQMVDEYGNPLGPKGIKGNGISVFLAVGSAIHEGLRVLFQLKDKELMVKTALESFKKEIEKGVLLIEPTEKDFQPIPAQLQWEVNNCKALIEGLLWAFYLKIFPELLDRFEILESEQDRGVILSLNGLDYQWMVKLDLLMKRKEDGELVAMSFKSLSSWNQRSQQAYQISSQNFSEPWAMEKKLEEWWHLCQGWNSMAPIGSKYPKEITSQVPEWFFRNGYDSLESPPKIHSMMMGVLLKGGRRKNEKRGLGWRDYYSPLVGGWKMDTGLGQTQYAWKYYFTKEDGSGGRLGKGWEKFNVWDEFDGGVREWVEMLNSGEVQPGEGDALLGLFQFPEPLPNRESFANRWVRQMVHQEKVISLNGRVANEMIKIGDFKVLDYLDEKFPMNTKNCYQWGGLCPMREICWERPDAVVEHNILRERFSPREVHHELEEGEEDY